MATKRATVSIKPVVARRVRVYGRCPRCARPTHTMTKAALTPRHGHEKRRGGVWLPPCTGSGLRMENVQTEEKMKQGMGPLFDRAEARTTDPATSKEAAKKMNDDGTTGELVERVLGALRAAPNGLTCHEIAKQIYSYRDSVSPRMKKLEEAGLIVRSHERRDNQTVWKAVKKAEPKPEHDLGGEA